MAGVKPEDAGVRRCRWHKKRAKSGTKEENATSKRFNQLLNRFKPCLGKQLSLELERVFCYLELKEKIVF